MRFIVRLSSLPVLVLVLVLVLVSPLTAQSDWEEVYPAPVSASGLTAFGDSIIAWCDGVIHVAGGDGQHWRALASDARFGPVFAYDGTRLYMATGNKGLFARDRGNEDFHLRNADILPAQDLLCIGDTLFMHTREDLYRSTDGGTHFEHLHHGPFRALLFHDGTSLFALFDRDSLRRSDDGGASWTACAYPFGWYDSSGKETYTLHRGALYASSPKVQGLRRSTDRGQSWQQMPDLPVGDSDRHYSPGVTALASTDGQLLIHTVEGAFRSTDEGVSWEVLSEGNANLTSLFPGPACLLANNASGCYRYESSPRHWRQVEFSHWTKYGISFVAFGRYLAGDLNRFSPDEGDSWLAQGEASWTMAARPDGRLIRVQQGRLPKDSSWLETSSDDGKHWVFLDSIPPGSHELGTNESLILLGSSRYLPPGIIYTLRLSNDDGAHWNELLTLPVASSAPRELSLNRRGDILFHSWPHSVFSSDEGRNWDTLQTPANDSLLAATLTENSLFLQSASGIWQRLPDGRMRDTRLTERLPEARIVGRWNEHLCIVGHDSLYFIHDTDGEVRSVPLPELLVGYPYTPSFAASTSCVFLTPGTATIFRLRLQDILDVSPAPVTPMGLTILGAAPHPLRERGTVHVQIDQAGTAELDLIDLLGRRRARLYIGHIEQGEHAVQASLPAVPPGCYLLRLCSGERTTFHPIVIER
ncbi:MAG: hypothetical protein KFF77_05975 [Bacteroidetes bacterium]|nr:hypothetical protein [Bacteroidota bacterium]